MIDLTDRQRRVLDFIVHSVERRGYPPSLREICEEMGISSTRGALRHLEALERKGYITRGSGARAIFVAGPRREASAYLPLVGQVPAGPLSYAAEEVVEEWVPVPQRLGGHEGRFLLRVKGDSMVGDHIQDGDLVVVAPFDLLKGGEIVVAVVDGEATVKHFHPQKGGKSGELELRPSNPEYAPIRVKGEEVHVAGRVVGVLRGL